MTKVLLVEDDKSLREIYAVRLVEEGYDIVSAGDGEEALAMAIKDRPNLIISDVMMPKISGFDMLDILRSTTETKDIRVIMMTALSSEDQRLRGVSLGADRYLVKSQVGIEDVVRTVHEVLGDAPVAGQTPLMTAARPISSAAPVMPPVAPIVAGLGARPAAPTPVAQPAPIATPAPVPVPIAPVSAPQFTPTPIVAVPQPVAMAPQPSVASPAPQQPSAQSGLPQPTAPFSTPRTGTLASRVIEPIRTVSTGSTPDLSKLMEQELTATPAPSAPIPPAPIAPVASVVASIPLPPVPPAPTIPPAPAPPSSGISFEETPRPISSTPAPVNFAPQPQSPQPQPSAPTGPSIL